MKALLKKLDLALFGASWDTGAAIDRIKALQGNPCCAENPREWVMECIQDVQKHLDDAKRIASTLPTKGGTS